MSSRLSSIKSLVVEHVSQKRTTYVTMFVLATGLFGGAGCGGPVLWGEVGESPIDQLGMPEVSRFADGLDVPDDWRGEPRIVLDTAADAA